MELELESVKVPADVQRLWFATLARPWSVLVVMPAHEGASSYSLAKALCLAGGQARGAPVRLVEAQFLELSRAAQLIAEARASSGGAGSTIINVGSPLSSSAAIPIALGSDGVLLCIELGKTEISAAKRTVELIGRPHFLGAVSVSPAGISP